MATEREPQPPKGSAPLDRIPGLEVGDTVGLIALLAKLQFEIKSPASPEQQAYERLVALKKLEHEQRLEIDKEAHRRRVENRHWYGTAAFLVLLAFFCGLVALLVPDKEVKERHC